MTDSPTPIVQNPGANPPGLDGEPKSVRDAWDVLADTWIKNGTPR
jgi:hypothetical protein